VSGLVGLRGNRLLGFLVILGLAVLLVNVKPTWAGGAYTITIIPSTPAPGVSFTINGKAPPTATVLSIWPGSACSGLTALDSFSEIGVFTQVVPGLPAGQYSVLFKELPYVLICDPFTVSAVIPEYPFGLAVLGVFMIIAYSMIRRRTRNNFS